MGYDDSLCSLTLFFSSLFHQLQIELFSLFSKKSGRELKTALFGVFLHIILLFFTGIKECIQLGDEVFLSFPLPAVISLYQHILQSGILSAEEWKTGSKEIGR